MGLSFGVRVQEMHSDRNGYRLRFSLVRFIRFPNLDLLTISNKYPNSYPQNYPCRIRADVTRSVFSSRSER